MRNRILSAFLAAAFLLAFGTAADALWVAHNAANSDAASGDCSGCHIPHKSPATKRGFPIAPSAGAITTYGYIGAFCLEKCHNATSVTSNDGGNRNFADLSRTVAAATFAGGAGGASVGSHGLNLLNSGGNAPNGTTVSNTLPYGNNTRTGPMECTTCHNVHDNSSGDTSSALLMLDIDILCGRCHTSRGNGATAWTTAALGTANPGSHPVGSDVIGDFGTAGDSPIRIGIGSAYGATAFDIPYDNGALPTTHNLGGHMYNGGGGAAGAITCVTCHAVHGAQTDPGDALPTTGSTGTEDLLVIAQGVMGATEPNRHANGAGDANNAICEGCHVAVGNVQGWNPGGTAFGHPADTMNDSDSTTAGLQAVPDFGNLALTNIVGSTVEWPFGPVTGVDNIGMGVNAVGGQARVICESCHTPHPLANNGSTDYTGVPASGNPILRRAQAPLCGVCHSATYVRHHPIGTGIIDGTNFADTAIVPSGTDLACSHCHDRGAHNWSQANYPGLNTNWEPSNNGRPDNNAVRYGTNVSKECNDCHRANSRHSPTANVGTAADIGGNVNYDDFGDGSHFQGVIAGGFSWATGYYNSATFNAQTTVWPVAAGGNNGWSRFAGTALPGELVCESCHDLEPDKNVASTPMLLAYFREGNTVATGRTPERYASEFCEGCHGRSPGGNVTHPMTTDNVTKVVDTGLGYDGTNRTTVTLITTGTQCYANAAGQPNDTNYPASAAMNCDTCHQVHDAATTSGTMILDSALARITNGTGGARSTAVNLYGVAYTRSVAADIKYQGFCTMCHTY